MQICTLKKGRPKNLCFLSFCAVAPNECNNDLSVLGPSGGKKLCLQKKTYQAVINIIKAC